MKNPPWDQRIARVLVRPLAATPITPNQVSLFTLAVALTGAVLLGWGEPVRADWGAGLFVLARFLDHFDGELARQTGRTSRLGYFLDYWVGAISYAVLFFAIGYGLRTSALGGWAIVLGGAAAAGALASLFINMAIDRVRAAATTDNGDASAAGSGDAIGYPGFAGFELEDGIYLLAPITWAGWLLPFFVLAAIGAVVYTLGSAVYLLYLARRA